MVSSAACSLNPRTAPSPQHHSCNMSESSGRGKRWTMEIVQPAGFHRDHGSVCRPIIKTSLNSKCYFISIYMCACMWANTVRDVCFLIWSYLDWRIIRLVKVCLWKPCIGYLCWRFCALRSQSQMLDYSGFILFSPLLALWWETCCAAPT